MTERKKKLENWLLKTLNQPATLVPIQGDASARQYFRIKGHDQFVAVDAHPDTENNPAFVVLSKVFADQDIRVPSVKAYDFEQGFMLITDLGDVLLLDVLNPDNVDHWYAQSFDILQNVSRCEVPNTYVMPHFDREHISKEFSYFTKWCLSDLLGLKLHKNNQSMLYDLLQSFISVFESSPQCVVHRDFHARNLLVQADGQLAMIDYQDAMIGPVSYDLVSLLKDCYIQWDEDQIDRWALDYFHTLKGSLCDETSPGAFMQTFDWVGLQRHLKVLGIFSRLKIRDHKDRYLHDMPRILRYIRRTCARYEALAPFQHFVEQTLHPSFLAFFQKAGIDEVA